MYRSGSSTRVSDEFFSPLPLTSTALVSSSEAAVQLLPTYNPESHVAKMEKNRLRSSETAIHLIPLLLVVCGVILWFFSTPVDMANVTDFNAARGKI